MTSPESPTTGTTHLVGRDADLARVATAFDAAEHGNPTFVLVLGEAGLGKTVFLRAATWLARARGLRTLAGTAIASGSSMPYLPLVAPLQAALASASAGPPGASAVRSILQGPSDSEEEADPTRASRLVEAIYELLAAEPTLLVVDDVHWADAATLTVLDYLGHRATSVPLAVIAAARDDEPGSPSSLPIADGRRYLQLPLSRLSRAAVRDQVSRLVGQPPPDSFVDELFARSAGNPLFVEELVSRAQGSPVATPSLRALVDGRVALLDGHARLVTDALAILGRPVDADTVSAVAGLTADAVEPALAAAARGGVVVRSADTHALRHPLFGEAIVANLTGTSRAAELHRRAATWLEGSGASPAELAAHWLSAGDRMRAWSTSLEAATQAEASSAFVEARHHLERAAAIWPVGRHGRDAVLMRAASAAWMAGDPDAAVELALEARSTGLDTMESTVALAQYLWDAGRRQESTDAFASVVAPDDAEIAPRSHVIALWGLGRGRIGQGDPRAAYRLAIEAAERAAEISDLTWVGHAWVLAGMSRAWMNDIGGLEELQRGFAASVQSDDPEAVGHAYQFLVEMLTMAGRHDEARGLGLEGISVCERLGLARWHGADLRGRTALVLIEAGDWTTAEGILDGAEPRAFVAMARALLAIRRGDWDVAEHDLDASTAELAIGGRGRIGGLSEMGKVELAWLRGEATSALAELEAVPPQPGVWATDLAVRRATWSARLGRPQAEPVEHFEAALAEAANAELAAARSGEGRAWLEAADRWQRASRPYERAVALLLCAEAAYQARDRNAGRTALEEALATARRLGAAPIVGRAERLAQRARISVGRRLESRADPMRLTDREREVLVLLAEGMTNPQIAQHLFISPKTVGIHVTHVLEKLDAHTRGEAVATARRFGLLS